MTYETTHLGGTGDIKPVHKSQAHARGCCLVYVTVHSTANFGQESRSSDDHLGHRPSEQDEDSSPLLNVQDVTEASHDSPQLQKFMQNRSDAP